MRQLLSLLAGDVIDVYLVERLKSIRTEHCIARWIHFMKSALWPGGKWFASLGPYAAARDAQNAGKRPQGELTSARVAHSQPRERPVVSCFDCTCLKRSQVRALCPTFLKAIFCHSLRFFPRGIESQFFLRGRAVAAIVVTEWPHLARVLQRLQGCRRTSTWSR